MARRIAVEIVGDGASVERAFLNAGHAASTFAATTVKASTTAAEARIAASAKQIASLRADQEIFATASASYVRGSDEQIAASKLLIHTQHRLQVAMGETAALTGRVGRSAGSAEREVGRFSRGALAGSGVIRGLGRSLAFASGGFLAFAGGATLIRDSIKGAESLEKAQKGVAVAIEHTGGNVAKLKPKYEATAKAAQQFGINQADALTGLERATVLTGDAVKAQRAYQEAVVISKATGKDFNAVLTATSKGQAGVTTSLRRYGILIAKGTPGAKQFQQVFARFGGQARANTSGIDRFNATLANTEEIIGTALLPVLNKYLGELGRWLDKMNKSGQLQHDVNAVVKTGASIFRTLGHVIHRVDRFTGSFKHTLELLLALNVASRVSRWTGALDILAGAKGAGGLLGSEAAAAKLLTKMRALAGLGVITIEVVLLEHFLQKYGLKNTARAGLDPTATLGPDITHEATIMVNGKRYRIGSAEAYTALKKAGAKLPSIGKVTARQEILAARKLGGSADVPPPPAQHHRRRRHHDTSNTRDTRDTRNRRDSSTATRTVKNFVLPYKLQLEQQQADLTRSTADDVRAAKDTLRYVKHLIATHKLSHKAMLVALQEEQSAYQTLWSADAAASQQHAKTAKKQAAAAKKSKPKKKQRLDFTEPVKLQIAEARAQALGISDTGILRKMKAAAVKALKSGKLSAQGQIDAWNEIASVNDQLGSSAKSALGGFKQASTRALTAGLGLDEAQRKALRARLSQLGPGGTVPGPGVGAAGYAIGSDDRPIVIHNKTYLDGREVARNTTKHQQKRRSRNPGQRRGPNAGIDR